MHAKRDKVSEMLIKFRLFFLANCPKTYQSWDEKQRINLERPKMIGCNKIKVDILCNIYIHMVQFRYCSISRLLFSFQILTLPNVRKFLGLKTCFFCQKVFLIHLDIQVCCNKPIAIDMQYHHFT